MSRLWKRPCSLLHTHGIPPLTQQQMVRTDSESNFRRSEPREDFGGQVDRGWREERYESKCLKGQRNGERMTAVRFCQMRPPPACVLSRFSRVRLFVTSGTAACPAPLSRDSPGMNTGVGCHALLQGIFLTLQGSYVSCIGRRVLYHLSRLGSPAPIPTHSHPIPFATARVACRDKQSLILFAFNLKI